MRNNFSFEYFSTNPIVIPFIRPNNSDNPDICDQCAGFCYHGKQGKLQISNGKCSPDLLQYSQQTLKLLLPKMQNSYITITPSNSNYYLDFISPSIAKNSNIFLRADTIEQPRQWILEKVGDSTAFIRTYNSPYYYLFANKDGSLGVSLYRGNNNQKWLVISPDANDAYNIINSLYCGYLTFSNKTSIAGLPVELTSDRTNSSLWNINIA